VTLFIIHYSLFIIHYSPLGIYWTGTLYNPVKLFILVANYGYRPCGFCCGSRPHFHAGGKVTKNRSEIVVPLLTQHEAVLLDDVEAALTGRR
jgi:hypothetical protein